MARCAAALSRRKPRPVRCAHRGRGARRPLDASRRHLSRLGRLFRNRSGARGRRRPGRRARAHLCQSRRAVRAGRQDAGCASTSPRRARSSRKRSDGWTTRSRICGQGSEKPGDEAARGRRDRQHAPGRESVHRAARRRNEPARGGGRRRRAADDVRRHAGHHRYRRAAGGGRRRAADGRPRQRSSEPLRRRAACPTRTLRRGARRPGAGAGRGLRRSRRAAVRHLPRLSGDECRVRRLAASRDPRAARPREPPHAAVGDGRDPSGSRRHLRRPPRCPPDPGRRLRASCSAARPSA